MQNRWKRCVSGIKHIHQLHYITFIPASAKDRLSKLMLFIVPNYTGFTQSLSNHMKPLCRPNNLISHTGRNMTP